MISVFFSTPITSKENLECLKNSCILPDVEVIQFVNQKTHSLAEAYNKGLEESKYPIVVFVHDDVLLEKGWDKKVYDHFQNSDYGILGVAGTTELDNTGMWWRKPQNMVGRVFHQSKEGKWYRSEYSHLIPNHIHQTVTVDGVFIAVHKERIKQPFDTEFKGFHFYDIPFCLKNHLESVKIGVIADFKLRHKSIGVIGEEWNKFREQFVKLYGEHLPATVAPIPFVSNRTTKLSQSPKVTIIIPTKDNFEVLKNCLDSFEKSNYQNFDIIIADTGSNEETLASIEKLTSDRIKLVKYDYYHFAKINNDVVKNHVDSNTELLLFCNDDIQLINDAISLMVEVYLKNKKTVGTIGCRLHFENNSVQHGGVLCYMNKENRMGFSHKGIRTFYGASFDTEEDILGNTGAFLMIRKALFQGIGGFDERPKECFEDVILNIDCILRNYKNIYVGAAACYHYESVTRKKNPKKAQMESSDANEFLAPKVSKHAARLKKYILNL